MVEIGDASCRFLQLVAMALRGDQRSQLVAVIATMAGSTYRPRRLLSQDCLTWGEWSSPGELIHPGDLASITSSEGELDLLLHL
jgi:hypothetical protein